MDKGTPLTSKMFYFMVFPAKSKADRLTKVVGTSKSGRSKGNGPLSQIGRIWTLLGRF